MGQNPGTMTIVVHARLPVRINESGLSVHENISDIPADGSEIDQLKAKFIAAYRRAQGAGDVEQALSHLEQKMTPERDQNERCGGPNHARDN
jgi:hypothetical protein